MDKKNKVMAGIPGLGERLRLFRKSFGYSAQELSERIQTEHQDASITRQVIFNIENGRKTDLTVTELVYISDALGLPYSALICDLTEPFRPIPSGPFKGKSTYEVINRFDPEKNADVTVNDEWDSLNMYLAPAINLVDTIKFFDSTKEALIRPHDTSDIEREKTQLTLLKIYLAGMETDVKNLKNAGAYVPEAYIAKIAESKAEYTALENQFEEQK